MNKRWLGLLAPLAALPIALGSGAGAATSWRTIGSGTAIKRGPQGLVWADVSVALSIRDPVAIRITYTDGNFTGRTHIDWMINGTAEGSPRFWQRWAEDDYVLPKTFTVSVPSWVDYVDMGASASTDPGAGPEQVTTNGAVTVHPIHMVVQAQY